MLPKNYVNESNEYKLGYMKRSPYGMDSWTNPAIADYNRGKNDRKKADRKRKRKTLFEDVLTVILGVPAVLLTLVLWAALSALPLVIVALVIKALFF